MELGAAASVISITDAAIKFSLICLQYSRSVWTAKSTVAKLNAEAEANRKTAKDVEALMQSPHAERLKSSTPLLGAMSTYQSQLDQIIAKLDPDQNMKRYGLRAWKWPFKSKEIEKELDSLGKGRENIELCLQVDGVRLVSDVSFKMDFSRSDIVPAAAYNSYEEDSLAKCLLGTRTEVLSEIISWVKNPGGPTIYWLNGMAGTGKSSIARTIASDCDVGGFLGASFFFKRGEEHRDRAKKFFPTLAFQMMQNSSDIRVAIDKAMQVDPLILSRGINLQFEELILKPLASATGRNIPVTIVVDGLDECDSDDDVEAILRLLPRLRTIKSSRLRVFLTSRPELPIRYGFQSILSNVYQDFILHEVEQPIMRADISLFFETQLELIREKRSIEKSWPTDEDLSKLVDMAVPLFIFATTVCLFIGDNRRNPKQSLVKVLEHYPLNPGKGSKDSQNIRRLGQTYLPVLNNLLFDDDEEGNAEILVDFRRIVGAVIVIANPLSVRSLHVLLDIPTDNLTCILDQLHSVLYVPESLERPVRVLHASFRDFLVIESSHSFSINEAQTHDLLLEKCLSLLLKPGSMRQNMAQLSGFGVLREDIPAATIEQCLPYEIEYACRYWTHHLEHGTAKPTHVGLIEDFLNNHLLHWIEIFGLLGKCSELIITLYSLEDTLKSYGWHQVLLLVHDARRFSVRNAATIDLAPLQVYVSCMALAPTSSTTKNLFVHHLPPWIQHMNMNEQWGPQLQSLVGHAKSVTCLQYSPTGRLASGSYDCTVRLWEPRSGTMLQTLQGHRGAISCLAFSENGMLASGSQDASVIIWDLVAGLEAKRFHGHQGTVRCICFAQNGLLASSGLYDGTTRVWNIDTGTTIHTLEYYADSLACINSDVFVLLSGRQCKIWDVRTGTDKSKLTSLESTVDYHSMTAVKSNVLALGGNGGTVYIWDMDQRVLLQQFQAHKNAVTHLSGSESIGLASASRGEDSIRVWNWQEMKLSFEVIDPNESIMAPVLYEKGFQLACIHASYIKLFEVDSYFGGAPMLPPPARQGPFAMEGSPTDSCVLFWGSSSKLYLGRWTTRTLEVFDGEPHQQRVTAVAFSSNGKLVTSGADDGSIKAWDVENARLIRTFDRTFGKVQSLAFHPDSQQFLSSSDISRVTLWSMAGQVAVRLVDSEVFQSVGFSPDGRWLACAEIFARQQFVIKSFPDGNLVHRFTIHGGFPIDFTFSSDAKLLAVAQRGLIQVLDTATWTPQQQFPYRRFPRKSSPPVRFSRDGSRMFTLAEEFGLSSSEDFQPVEQLRLKNNWVFVGEEKVFYIPPEKLVAPENFGGSIMISRGTLVIGHYIDEMNMLQIDLDHFNMKLRARHKQRQGEELVKENSQRDQENQEGLRAQIGRLQIEAHEEH